MALTAGVQASSTALIGFGLDSVIEVSSAAAVAWQFAGRDPEARERTALRRDRVLASSAWPPSSPLTRSARCWVMERPQHSTVGLVLAAVSLVVMPLLSYGQRRTGRELGSGSAVADSKQTLLCTYLSAVLLVGLGLNSLFGWSWADPIAGLVIAGVAVREGVEAWRGDTCCTPVTALHANASTEQGCGCESGCTDACCAPAGKPATTTTEREPRPTTSWLRPQLPSDDDGMSSPLRSSAARIWPSHSVPSWRPLGSWSPRSQRHVVIIASTRIRHSRSKS